MGLDFFPHLIGASLSVGILAWLAHGWVPRLAEAAGWGSGIVASLPFVAMVAVDAFQPELPEALQHLAMPAPAVRTTAYWLALCLHVAIGAFGAAYCASMFASRRRSRVAAYDR